jgi:hypothetical protein
MYDEIIIIDLVMFESNECIKLSEFYTLSTLLPGSPLLSR